MCHKINNAPQVNNTIKLPDYSADINFPPIARRRRGGKLETYAAYKTITTRPHFYSAKMEAIIVLDYYTTI